ncbi:MAG: TonB-dependent receptor [Tannerella sp.]|nr:TonB-dependent receptor [Tannerella sp.]
MQRYFALLRICFFCAYYQLFITASAQNVDTVKTIQLQDVEVVGQGRMPVTRQSSPLQILGSKDIKRLGIYELHEAVRRFSGVTVKDYGGIGGLKTVSIRSLGAHHTAVSYDGVVISDVQSGQVDISRFTLDNVEMISLSTGQTDDIFRTARFYASAGALEINTQKPQFSGSNKNGLSAKLKGGSFGLINPVLSYHRKMGNIWSATVHGDYMRADSKYPFTLTNGLIKTREERLNSDIASLRTEVGLYGDFRKGGSLETKLYIFDSERGLPGSVKLYNRTSTERLWNDNSFVQTRYKNSMNRKIEIQAIGKYSYSHTRYRDINDNYAAGMQEDRNTQQEYYVSGGFLYKPVKYFSVSGAVDYAYTMLRNNFLNAPQPRRNNLQTALAAQYKSKALTITGSLPGAYISDKVETGERPADRKRLSPALSFSWRPLHYNALRIRASYKDIYRVPTFTDLYYLRVGNTNLKPESASQYNVGLTWGDSAGRLFSYLSMTVDGYYNKIDNKIVALPTMYIWRMMNMGKVEIKGIDVNLSAEKSLSRNIYMIISGNYTFQSAIDITDSNSKNYRDQIPYTPRHTGNGAVSFEILPWINVSWLLTAVGERYVLPQNIKANKMASYTEQSISVNRTFMLNDFTLRLQGEILNITDTQYDVIQYYPMPGRSWRISFTFIL